MIRYNIGEQLKMQSHWNACQNLNITTSHILANDKNRNIVGKRINKMHKTSHLQTYYNELQPQNHKKNQELQIKSTKKNQENNSKKSNQPKAATQSKKTHKKKHPSLHRNAQTPEIFNNQRRLKTQGTLTDQDLIPSIKKQHKKTHIKSVSQGSKNMQTSKKQKIKPTKTSKDKHVKSCQIYGAWKKLELPHHTISQTIHGVVNKKKRNNSSLVCNDKVVSRLLNASLLASQIGASPLVTSDRKTPHSSHSRTFKQYMSSIDLRIIRKIQDDVPIFLQKQSTFQDTIRSLMRRNDISLQQLTRKVTIIQRCWRARQRKSIINTYKRLFQRATDNFFRQDKFVNDVSEIEIEVEKSDSNIDIQLFRNQNRVSSLKKKSEDPSHKNSLQEEEWSEDYRDGGSSFQKEEEGLNFGKYRQLVKQQIKSLNKKMGVENHQKKGLDSKYLLQELMKHNFNKKWIEQQSSSLSDRKIETKQQHIQSSQSQQSQLNQHTIQTYPKLSKNDEDDASFDDSQIYDRNKYAMNHLLQDGQEQSNLPKKLKAKQQLKIQIKPKNKPAEQQPIDLQWINNQLHQDQIIVKNYLDCGLQKFTLQNQVSSQSHSSDQAIGQRFQRANLAILRKKDNKNQVQQELSNLSSIQSEEIITAIVNLLLNQFASDISVILKKCNTALPQRPKHPPAPRPNGIETSYNSIKSYVQKVIFFVKQRDSVAARIVENINKDIGPTSLEILSYLRPQPEDSQSMPLQSQSQENEDQDGLFVIPAQLFQQFQTHLESEHRKQQKKEMGPRIKAYLSFWNRCIFQSFNQCLDYQRPFGVQGKPYDWLKQRKVFRKIQKQKIPFHLGRAQKRLLEQTEIVAGVMFQNQNAIMGSEISQQQMHMMNQERLSRILACQLLQSQNSWINYNDEMAELLVELSRIIEQKLFFEFSGSQLKKLLRHRRILAQQSYIEQSVQFDLNELQ